MEVRRLGRSGLEVPVLSFGAGTFGGEGPLFRAWGDTDAAGARRLVDLCIERGVTLFDTADVYSNGASEEILGAAIAGRRERVLVSTKTSLPLGDGPADAGSSRSRLLRATEASLRRFGTDWIDLLQLHAFDARTPIEEVLATLDDLVRQGKVRYVGVSNFAGWQLMKSLGIAKRYGYPRYVAHQVYYSLVGRDYEWELLPLGLDQGVGALVWSPLGWGRLTGKVRRGSPVPAASRLHLTAALGPAVDAELLFDVVDVLDEIAKETGRTVPQIALNWLTTRDRRTVKVDGKATLVGRFDTPEQWSLPFTLGVHRAAVRIGFDSTGLTRALFVLVRLGLFWLLRGERHRALRHSLLREKGSERRAGARTAFRVDVRGTEGARSLTLSFDRGQAALTAAGAVLSVRQALALGGRGGVFFPELDPANADLPRLLAELGVGVHTVAAEAA